MKNNLEQDKKDVVILLNGKSLLVPPGGSIGILALGNVGVRAWKKAKKEWEEKQTAK